MAPDSKPAAPSKGALVALAIGVGLLLFVVFSANAFNLAIFRPTTPNLTLIFAAVSALIFVLLIALTFVLMRNLLKLYAERRLGKLGSRFRTRMVIGALALSFLPAVCLFLFAYQLIGRSMDKWFAYPVDELHANSSEVASLLSNYAVANAAAEAQEIAALPEAEAGYKNGNFTPLIAEFRRRQTTLQGGFVLALEDGALVAGFDAPGPWAQLRSQVPALAAAPADKNSTFELQDRDFVMGAAPVGDHGRIIVAMPLPPNLRAMQQQIDASTRNYYELSLERKELRRTYVSVLSLLTVVVVFVATWMALFLSKLVTRPVEALAEATQEISRGRYDYRIAITAADEFGALVDSFNRMAAELEGARMSMEASSRDLAGANNELDQRRRQMETILESVPAGVLSLDAQQRIVRANRALARIFARTAIFGDNQFPAGSPLREAFPAEVAAQLEPMMRRADRMGSVTSQMETQAAGRRLTLAVTVAALHHDQQRLGWVIVFDDLSDLLKANQQAAWQEVARRVAHEIKNPLTPIALSAERIQRHVERADGPSADPATAALVRECTRTISSAVETVRTLVNEFSSMARFPASQPQTSDVNAIVTRALSMFNGRLDGIALRTELAGQLPPVWADPNAIQRAIANIVDNAAEAMHGSLMREIQISTALLAGRGAVEIAITDTGPGMNQDVKEKLFFPYFSTKKRGTGLGLAIVRKIVEEHHGSVRVEDNSPVGTRFVLELPLAREGQAKPA